MEKSLSFCLNLTEDAVTDICNRLSPVVMDLLESDVSKFCGYLTVSRITSNNSSNVIIIADKKRKADANQASTSKAKFSKRSLTASSASGYFYVTDKATSSFQTETSDFQQDVNDLVSVMQSLETGKNVYCCKMFGLQGNHKPNIARHVEHIARLKHMECLKERLKCLVCEREFHLKHIKSLLDG